MDDENADHNAQHPGQRDQGAGADPGIRQIQRQRRRQQCQQKAAKVKKDPNNQLRECNIDAAIFQIFFHECVASFCDRASVYSL